MYDLGFETYNPVLNFGGLYVIVMATVCQMAAVTLLCLVLKFTRPIKAALEGGSKKKYAIRKSQRTDPGVNILEPIPEEVNDSRQDSDSETPEKTSHDLEIKEKPLLEVQPKRATEQPESSSESELEEPDVFETVKKTYVIRGKEYTCNLKKLVVNRTCIETVAERKSDSLFFNQFIGVTKESLATTLMSALLFINMPDDLKEQQKEGMLAQLSANYVLSIFFVALNLVIFPVAAALLICTPRKKLKRGTLKRRFGAFWEAIDTRRASSRAYALIWIIRRIIVIMAGLFLSTSGMQLLTLLYLNMFHMIYFSHVKPYTDK